MGRNGDRPPWDEDPMGHSGTVGTGSYETETPWGATDRPPWDGDPKEHMGMVEMGSYETNTPWGAMGTDLHGMKTPWGAMAQWGRDPMRPRPHGAQRGPTPMG